MKRPALNLARDRVRARMEAGELMDWKAVWRETEVGSSGWARSVLLGWKNDGLIHIDHYVRGDCGPPRPVYRWGPGEDADRPVPFTTAEKCKKWRRENPDMVRADKKRNSFRRRKTPMIDPVVAALLGYRRRGGGWVKPSPD